MLEIAISVLALGLFAALLAYLSHIDRERRSAMTAKEKDEEDSRGWVDHW